MLRMGGGRGHSHRIHLYVFVIAVLGAVVLSVFFFERSLKPTLLAFARAEARVLATHAVTSVLEEEIATSYAYEDIYDIHYDNRGKVAFLRPDMRRIGTITTRAARKVQERLDAFGETTIDIPLARLLGLEVLAGLGPTVRMHFYPVGMVETELRDVFEGAGINQTRHRIYLDIEGQVRVLVPFASGESGYAMQIPVAEGIIIGDVPPFHVAPGGF